MTTFSIFRWVPITVVLIVALAAPAAADHDTDTSTLDTGFEHHSGHVVLWGESTSVEIRHTTDGCPSWEPFDARAAISTGLPVRGTESNGYYIRETGGRIDVFFTRICHGAWASAWFTEGISLRAAAEQARSLLQPGVPTPRFAPPALATRTIVGIDTWFWVPQTQWRPINASISVSGTTITATATPVTIRFDPGDGSEAVECAGPGVIWTQGAETSCRYVYQYVSAHDPTGMWPGILDVDWDVTWEASSGESGFLEPLRTSIGLTLTVEEIQVTVTR
jgi:hypothetical protein